MCEMLKYDKAYIYICMCVVFSTFCQRCYILPAVFPFSFNPNYVPCFQSPPPLFLLIRQMCYLNLRAKWKELIESRLWVLSFMFMATWNHHSCVYFERATNFWLALQNYHLKGRGKYGNMIILGKPCQKAITKVSPFILIVHIKDFTPKSCQ